jgi:glutathione peroxidase
MTHAIAATIFAAAMLTASVSAGSVYDYTLMNIDGRPQPLAAYKGKVLLIVNVASRCGFTPQYAALERLYETYKDRGLVVIGVPANNFGGQEPGTNEEIKVFCSRNYHVSFPMMAKLSVKGDDMAPLYKYLTSSTGAPIGWNFTKVLIGRDGAILKRFDSAVKPDAPELITALDAALK